MEVLHDRPTSAETRQDELILDALKRALAENTEQRLYRSGKLGGLFPLRSGVSAEAALRALAEELLETVRTETKGKQITEWVRLTPKGVRFIQERDSAKAVLRELKEVIGETRGAVPLWMHEATEATRLLAERFERQGQDILARLDTLTDRVDAALRRLEAGGQKASRLPESVPWAMDVLKYLDDRQEAGAVQACSLAELFHAMRSSCEELTLGEFQMGLTRLADAGAVRLCADLPLIDPEYAILHGNQLCTAVER